MAVLSSFNHACFSRLVRLFYCSEQQQHRWDGLQQQQPPELLLRGRVPFPESKATTSLSTRVSRLLSCLGVSTVISRDSASKLDNSKINGAIVGFSFRFLFTVLFKLITKQATTVGWIIAHPKFLLNHRLSMLKSNKHNNKGNNSNSNCH